MQTDCALIELPNGKWFCPDCTRAPLPKKCRRWCRARSTGAEVDEPLPPTDPSLKPLILLIGLHRSLSTCLAEVLQRLGVYMGRGNGGEDEKFAGLLETFMPFPSTDLRAYREKPCARERLLGELVRHYLMPDAGDRPAGVKYPHFCRFAVELERAWPNLKIIHAARPLAESIESLATRSAKARHFHATRDQAARLERFLFREKSRFLATRPHLTVVAENLLVDPAREVDRLIEYLRPIGLDPSAEQRRAAIEHVDPQRAPHTQAASKTRRRRWTDDTTVVIKTFERPGFLQELIESIRQRHPEARIIVADDGRRPTERHDVEWHRLPCDSGLSAGRNYLVDQVRTPYLLLCDDDFLFTDQTDVASLHAALERTGLDLVAGDAARAGRHLLCGRFDQVGDELHLRRGYRASDGDVLLADWVPNFFIARTKALKKCRWDDRLKVGEHADFFLRFQRQGLRAGLLRTSIVHDRAGGGGEYDRFRRRASKMHIRAMARAGRRYGFRHFANEHLPQNSIRSLDTARYDPIPQTLHQVWIGPNPLPDQHRQWADAWQTLHPDWKYQLWGEAAEDLLWPNLRAYYDRATSWAQRADFLRLAVLYRQGGLYLDTDFEPLRAVDGLLTGGEAFCATAGRDGRITNAVLAAVPQHPFVGDLLRAIPAYFDADHGASIGPRMVTAIARGRDDVTVWPQEHFYPVEFADRKKLRGHVHFPDSYAVHHFAASWV